MNAPLSRFLTRFSDADVTMPVAFEIIASEPTVALTVGELQSRIDAARETALRDAEARHAGEMAALAASRDLAVADAVSEARALWCADTGAAHAEALAAAFSDLETNLSTGVAAVLRPLLATAVVERTCKAVREAIDHVLANPDHPVVTVRGPAALIDVIRDARTEIGKAERVVYLAADTFEMTVDAAGSHIETRLAAALAALKGL